jgi:hypothetical protein
LLPWLDTVPEAGTPVIGYQEHDVRVGAAQAEHCAKVAAESCRAQAAVWGRAKVR